MRLLFLWLSLFVCTACESFFDFEFAEIGSNATPREVLLPSPSFKVAFVGDQGLSDDARNVLRLIRGEKVGLLVIPGDFDYVDRPDLWDAMLNEELGDLPILAAVGNHDLPRWPEYASLLSKRLARMPKARCSGEIGVKQNCFYEGVQFVISGVGTLGGDHDDFIEESLEDSPAVFKICVWHKNQREMQVGNKKDEVGWDAYELCREAGAMIVTAHEHSYSRTHLLSDFSRQSIASTSSTLRLEPEKSFALVTGLGGQSIRAQALEGPYWAKIYTSTQKATNGAVFCTFNSDDPRRADCMFKNVRGEAIDSFVVESRLTVDD